VYIEMEVGKLMKKHAIGRVNFREG